MITPLPQPPSRASPNTFSTLADSFLGALPAFATEANALQTDVNAKQVTASNAAITATTQAGTASTAATTATTQAGIATTKAAEAAGSLAGVLAVNSNYLSPKAADPIVNDQGGALTAGLLYFNTTTGKTRVYNGTAWQDSGSSVNGTANRYRYIATANQTVFTAVYDIGFVDVYLNGLKLDSTDFTATNGTSITLLAGAGLDDVVNIIGYGAFQVSNTYTQAQTNALITAAVPTLAQLHAIALLF